MIIYVTKLLMSHDLPVIMSCVFAQDDGFSNIFLRLLMLSPEIYQHRLLVLGLCYPLLLSSLLDHPVVLLHCFTMADINY
jgi:hypothetical protein